MSRGPGAPVAWDEVAEILVDPHDGSPLRLESGRLVGATRSYEIRNDQPVLLTGEPLRTATWSYTAVEVGQQQDIRNVGGARERLRRLVKRAGGTDRTAATAVEVIAGSLDPGRRSRALVVGGGTVGLGSAGLHEIDGLDVVSIDVYASPFTTMVADAHQLPFGDGTFDVVWVQAVLEHVVDPALVVGQVARVMRTGGIVYVETPFLQPVHEGAFDFTRFSHSGHRVLLAGFEELRSGPLGGPGTVLSLAIRGVVGGLTRSRLLGRVAGTATTWLSWVDRLIPAEWRVDFAAGVYFLGRRVDAPAAEFHAADYYRGAQ